MNFSELPLFKPWWQDASFITYWLATSIELFPFLFIPKHVAMAMLKTRKYLKFEPIPFVAAFVGVHILFFFIRLGPGRFILELIPEPWRQVSYFLMQVMILVGIDLFLLAIGKMLRWRTIVLFSLIDIIVCLVQLPHHLVWFPLLPGEIIQWFAPMFR